jgi:hypothetical protein
MRKRRVCLLNMKDIKRFKSSLACFCSCLRHSRIVFLSLRRYFRNYGLGHYGDTSCLGDSLSRQDCNCRCSWYFHGGCESCWGRGCWSGWTGQKVRCVFHSEASEQLESNGIMVFWKDGLLVDVTGVVQAPVVDDMALDPKPIATTCVQLQLAAEQARYSYYLGHKQLYVQSTTIRSPLGRLHSPYAALRKVSK